MVINISFPPTVGITISDNIIADDRFNNQDHNNHESELAITISLPCLQNMCISHQLGSQ